MPSTNARRALYTVCFTALALLAIIAAGLGAKPPATQGAALTGVAPSPEPKWEQLMGRSVQARKAGAIREAEILLQQAANLAAAFGPHDMRRAQTRMGQAEFYLWSGQPVLAEQAYKEAVTIGEATGGADHPEMVSLLEGLANFYYYRERYDEVVPIFTRILEIVRVATPHDPHEEARRLRNLAQVHQLRGKYAEAESQYLQALRLVEASAQRSPAEVAEYLQATAECYRAWGKAKLAEPLAARALELMESLAGPDTLDVVPHLKTLAEVRMDAGEPQRAAGLYERALAIVERVSGAEHSDLEPFLLGLAAALRTQGKLSEADVHVSRAKEITERTWSPAEIASSPDARASTPNALQRMAEPASERGGTPTR
jgi:tetratricopeptide (TPR) repeat protein